MASFLKYQNAGGATLYAVRYRTPDNRQSMKRGFKTKREAQRWAARTETDIVDGNYVAPSKGKISVGELAPDWLARKEVSTAPSHYRTLESSWRVHVKPYWGTAAITDIDVLEVEAWVQKMIRDGAGTTVVLRAYGVLSGIMTDAVKGKRLRVNPVKGAENLPRKVGKRRVYLTDADVDRLADKAGEYRALVLVLAYCGLRWGEAIALRVADVQFLRRRISVHQNAVQIGVAHKVGLTKGRESRSVPVPAFLLDELSRQCAGKEPADLVFPGNSGGYLPRPKSSNGWFTRAVKAAKVQAITPHDLRHTCASLAISSGASVLALARMLGHKDPSVTLRVYADLFDDDLDAVAAALHTHRSEAKAKSVQDVFTSGG